MDPRLWERADRFVAGQPAIKITLAATSSSLRCWGIFEPTNRLFRWSDSVLLALVIGPATAALLWSHHPFLALMSAPPSAQRSCGCAGCLGRGADEDTHSTLS